MQRKSLATAICLGALCTLSFIATAVAVPNRPAAARHLTAHDSWFQSLEPLPNGGWKYFTSAGSAGHDVVVFVSTHDVLVQGTLVTAWFRWEYETAQLNGYTAYKSAAERVEIDCTSDAMRDLATTYYSRNNFEGASASQMTPATIAEWSPSVPGTIGEQMVNWGCAQTRARHH